MVTPYLTLFQIYLSHLLLFDINYGGMDNEAKRDLFTEKGTMWEMPIQFRNDWDAG